MHCDRQRMLPLGMNDKPRTSRVKVYCPRCEESYVPNRGSARSLNLDGSVFGTSLPHVFLKYYPTAVVRPPKIYHYTPKIFGFQVYGKPGSKFYRPTVGGIRFTEDEQPTGHLVQQFKAKFVL